MKISTRGRYGLRLVLDLALNSTSGKWVSLKDISRRQKISEKYLWQLANSLKSNGIISVLRGPRGGFALARETEDIKLDELLRVLEGNLSLLDCNEEINEDSGREEIVSLKIWQEIENKLLETMQAISIQSILDKQRSGEGLEGWSWQI